MNVAEFKRRYLAEIAPELKKKGEEACDGGGLLSIVARLERMMIELEGCSCGGAGVPALPYYPWTPPSQPHRWPSHPDIWCSAQSAMRGDFVVDTVTLPR